MTRSIFQQMNVREIVRRNVDGEILIIFHLLPTQLVSFFIVVQTSSRLLLI